MLNYHDSFNIICVSSTQQFFCSVEFQCMKKAFHRNSSTFRLSHVLNIIQCDVMMCICMGARALLWKSI